MKRYFFKSVFPSEQDITKRQFVEVVTLLFFY